MDFKTLKQNRENITDQLRQEIDKHGKTNYSDDREWKLARNKSNVGSAIIRFLPAPPCDGNHGFPFIETLAHSFQGPSGKYYIENCPTTLDKKCPCCEANGKLWDTGVKENQDIVRTRKRKTSYYSNIYVVKDVLNPENEGKVFLFRYGKKIFDMITVKLHPKFEGEEPMKIFCLWEGSNFNIKIQKEDGYFNYNSSSFDPPSEIAKTDKDKETIWNKAYSLKEYHAEDRFKSYDDLKEKVSRVLGTPSTPSASQQMNEMEVAANVPEDNSETPEGEDFDNQDFFNNLINETA